MPLDLLLVVYETSEQAEAQKYCLCFESFNFQGTGIGRMRKGVGR